ncbi:MAG: lytic murein transglycosylase [Methyloceanibacter sp.]|jgi:membrane-bound lytic murein transglycosylase B
MRIARTLTLTLFLLGLAAFSAASLPERAEAATQTFAQWVEKFWPTAKAAGITRATYDKAFKDLTPDPKVIEAANFQPEYVKPIGEYIDRVVSEKRIATGKQMLEQNKDLLDSLEKRYGVDRTILVAIWGVESNYGTQPGDMNVIRSLATLAYYNTKATFARQQLIVALKIVQHGDIAVDKMNGSWAGAMGHTQFIPTTYQMFAVDYDGDGKRDIWSDVPDALASTANYLRHANWQPGQTWGYEVTLPKGFNPKKVSDKTLKRLADWQKLGFTRVGGEPFPRPGDKASLLAPAGTNGPAFLVLNNFRSILHYNVSTSYALGVGHLSDRLKGSGPFVHPWPTDENHLALDQRVELQKLLMAKGLLAGDADGVIGPATLEAVKSFQRSKGLPVDGFPNRTILELLRKEG